MDTAHGDHPLFALDREHGVEGAGAEAIMGRHPGELTLSCFGEPDHRPIDRCRLVDAQAVKVTGAG